MAFTKIAAAGIGSTGTVTLQHVVVTGSVETPVITGAASTANVRANSLVVSGVSTLGSVVATTGTFSGNVSIAGTLTYEDVTNIDSVGLITARSGIRVTSGGLVVTSGVSTFTNSPVLIGSGTSTGTASQPLQVTGGAYVSGNLGIGTTNPTNTLHVVNSSYPTLSADAGSNKELRLQFHTGDNTANVTSIGAFPLVFQTNSIERLRITSTGDILKQYGTTLQSYTSGGSISHMMSYGSWNGTGNILVVGNTFDAVVFATGGGAMTEKARITSAGNIGIGTNNPNVLLDVFKTSFPEINLRTGTVTSTFGIDTGNNTFVVGSTSNHPFTLRTNGTDRLYLTSGGNIGIGLTNPSSILNVGSQTLGTNTDNRIILAGRQIGSIGTFASFYFKNSQDSGGSSASIRALREGDNYGTELAFFTQNSGGASGGDGVEAVRINRGGSVGIGTATPSVKLHVQGNTWINNNSTDNSIRAQGLTVSFSPSSNFTPGADPGDTLRNTSFMATGSTRPSIITLRNIDNNNAFYDLIADGNTNSFYIQRATSSAPPAFTINSSNYIGIGIANPDNRLHVRDAVDSVPVRFQSGAGDCTVGFRANGDANTFNTRCGSYAASGFGIWTASSIKVNVDLTGNIITTSNIGSGLDVGYKKFVTITGSFAANTWYNTGIDRTTDTGIYLLSAYVDTYNTGQSYQMSYIGWFVMPNRGTNSGASSNITLHSAGHAPNAEVIQFRTLLEPAVGGSRVLLQWLSNFNLNLNGNGGNNIQVAIYRFGTAFNN